MPQEPDYSKREIDTILKEIRDNVSEIKIQTRKTNGRVTKLERNMLVVACIVGTMLAMSGSRILEVLKLFI